MGGGVGKIGGKGDMEIGEVLRGLHVDAERNGLVPARGRWVPVGEVRKATVGGKGETGQTTTTANSSESSGSDQSTTPTPPSPLKEENEQSKEPISATKIGKHTTPKPFNSACDLNMDSTHCTGCNTDIKYVLSYICLQPKCGRRYCGNCAWLLVRGPEIGGVDGDLEGLRWHWKVHRGEAREEDAPAIRCFKKGTSVGAELVRRLGERGRKGREFEERWGRKVGE